MKCSSTYLLSAAIRFMGLLTLINGKYFVGYMLFKKTEISGIHYLALVEEKTSFRTPLIAKVGRKKTDTFHTVMGKALSEKLGLTFEDLMEIPKFDRNFTEGEPPKSDLYRFRIAMLNDTDKQITLSGEYKLYKWLHFYDAFHSYEVRFRGMLSNCEKYLRRTEYYKNSLLLIT